MICPNCGAELPAGKKFCHLCGAKLPESVDPIPSTEPVSYPAGDVFQDIPKTVPASQAGCTDPWAAQAPLDEPTAAMPGYPPFQDIPKTAPVNPDPSPAPAPAKPKKSKGLIAATAVLAVLMCACAGLAAFLYLTMTPKLRDTQAALDSANAQVAQLSTEIDSLDSQIDVLNTNVDALNQELTDRDSQIGDLESQNQDLQAQNETLQSEKDTLEATLQDQDASLADLSADAGSFRQICTELYGKTLGWASNSFNSSDWLVIQKTTDGPREIVITANWNVGGSVTLNHSSDHCQAKFVSDSYDTTVNVTISPSSPGIDVLTFTNSVNDETFRVLVIVF